LNPRSGRALNANALALTADRCLVLRPRVLIGPYEAKFFKECVSIPAGFTTTTEGLSLLLGRLCLVSSVTRPSGLCSRRSLEAAMRPLAWGIVLAGIAAGAVGAKAAETGPLAVSGGAEIEEISLHRSKVAYADPDADLAHLRVALWFPFDKGGAAEAAYLVRLVSIDPIRDDTGKGLTGRKRLPAIRQWLQPVRAHNVVARDRREGPVLELTLDAPVRTAKRLQLLAGKVEVTRIVLAPPGIVEVSSRTLAFEFKDLELP
jgi:hypothetical protein